MSLINALLRNIWYIGIGKLADKPVADFTKEDWKELARVFWKMFTEGFWERFSEVKQIWDLYGGPEWLIPFIIIIIIIIIIYLIRKRRVTPDIDLLVKEKKIRKIIQALTFKNKEIATVDKDHLEKFKGSQAVKIRCTAAVALGKFGDPRAINHLIAALNDPDKYVRMNVVRALGKFGGERIKCVLKVASERDKDEFVRYLAQDVLDEI